MKEKLMKLLDETPGICMSTEALEDLVDDIQAVIIQHTIAPPVPPRNRYAMALVENETIARVQ